LPGLEQVGKPLQVKRPATFVADAVALRLPALGVSIEAVTDLTAKANSVSSRDGVPDGEQLERGWPVTSGRVRSRCVSMFSLNDFRNPILRQLSLQRAAGDLEPSHE
jgi:hypothetical protein